VVIERQREAARPSGEQNGERRALRDGGPVAPAVEPMGGAYASVAV